MFSILISDLKQYQSKVFVAQDRDLYTHNIHQQM